MSQIQIIHRDPIEKGWSGDRKYRAVSYDGTPYLLRISPASQFEGKKIEFTMMRQAAALGVPMCVPVEFGVSEEGVYSLQSWIEGADAEEVMPTFSCEEQYSYGFCVGQALQKIHSLSAPMALENWEDRYARKIERKLRMYEECPLRYEKGELFIKYIEANRHRLSGRPTRFQHGDFHIGNMMIGNDGRIYIIDFNRADFGDPWEEFNRISWSAKASPSFATGMLNGYFDDCIPEEFWRLLALYIATNTLSSLPWAIPFGEGEVRVMREQAQDVLSWYDDFKTIFPAWYLGVWDRK